MLTLAVLFLSGGFIGLNVAFWIDRVLQDKTWRLQRAMDAHILAAVGDLIQRVQVLEAPNA